MKNAIFCTAVASLATAIAALPFLTREVRAADIEGSSSGIFVNPAPAGAIVSGVGTDFFTWGDAQDGTGPSSLEFTGTPFSADFEEVFSVGTLTFFNGIIFSGAASSVDLEVTVMLTMPSGITEEFIQTLRLINTPNTTDPIESADIVFVPTSFPDTVFTISGVVHTLSIIGFGSITGDGFATLDKFNVLEEASASAELLARIAPACVVPEGREVKVEGLSGIGTCGPVGMKSPTWGTFGQKPGGVLVFNSGEALEVECSQALLPSGLTATAFQYFYTPPGGSRMRVGVCPFAGGCNSAWFFHPGDNDEDGMPDCLIKTRWISRDYGFNDKSPNPWTGVNEPTDEKLDWADIRFDANTTKLLKLDQKWDYRFAPFQPPVLFACDLLGAFKPEALPVQVTEVIDPLLGPETEEFFDQVLERLRQQPEDGVMEAAPLALCDLDRDGDCDVVDLEVFQNAMGTCVGQPGYHALADGDLDGCVTPDDQQFVFFVLDIKPNQEPNPVNLRSRGVIPVAILTTNAFDATTVDPMSVEFGPSGALEAHARGHIEDADGDGDLDLVLHFAVRDTGILAGDTEACLRGETFDGMVIEGCDAITIVGR